MGCHMQQEVVLQAISCSDHFAKLSLFGILWIFCQLNVQLTARHSSEQQPMALIVKTCSVSCPVSKAEVAVFLSNPTLLS